ncbi:SDR family oxidoreductase [Sphingopyxis terrae]|uniref:SDR family oxidoreductase n=1 Tax=Sphingopyxis terrae TaxID=33052 RepID=UPI002A16551F|nr:SDR family oxidoreductase [Sphingopyxis terrae]MDX8356415.1 SDR family oxidoreductase [Sphingopyxis terrae]
MYKLTKQCDRRVLITGSNSGLGKEAAFRFAAAGADLIMAVRSLAKGEAVKAEIVAAIPEAQVRVVQLDVSTIAGVRACATGLLQEDRPIDLLINNAGVMAPPARTVTDEGFELQFATNFLGPFALTNLLLPLLLRGKSPRVVTMTSSAAHFAAIDWDDLQSAKRYAPIRAYGQSKLADMLLGVELGRLATRHGWAVTSTLAHPGNTRTNLQSVGPNLGTDKTHIPLGMRLVPAMTVERGVESLLLAADDPDAVQGAYYGPKWFIAGSARRIRLPKTVRDADLPHMWEVGESLTGVTTAVG